MARFTSDFKQAFLVNLWESCPEGATTLQAAILAALRGQVQFTEGGFLVSSTSQPGHSSSFFVPNQGGGLTPVTLAELCNELRRRYEWAKAKLSTDDEALIYAEMLSRLEPCRKTHTDFSTYLSGGVYNS